MNKYSEFSFGKEYQGSFVLNEDTLRRIDEAVKDALGKGAKVEYEIRLENKVSYTTEDIDDITQEENSKKEKITKISLNGEGGSYGSSTYKRISIDFGSWGGNEITLSIRGRERDWISLTQNKLGERLSKLKRWYSPASSYLFKEVCPMIFSFPLAIIMILLVARFFQEFAPSLKVVFFVVGWIISSLLFRFIRWLFPDFLFEFGEQIKHSQDLSEVRRNIFWVILIGGFLSIAIGVYFR